MCVYIDICIRVCIYMLYRTWPVQLEDAPVLTQDAPPSVTTGGVKKHRGREPHNLTIQPRNLEHTRAQAE